MIYVTRDDVEKMSMADKIVVLSGNRVELKTSGNNG